MRNIRFYTIDDLFKAEVKGYTRTRKGKMERVSPYSKQFVLKEKRVDRAIGRMHLDTFAQKIVKRVQQGKLDTGISNLSTVGTHIEGWDNLGSVEKDRIVRIAKDLLAEPKGGIKTIGSQKRESLESAGYDLVSRKGREVILKDKETGKHERWIRNDSFAGYVVDIGGKGYEFVESIKKAIPPDEWERPKRPYWHQDPGHKEEEGIRERREYEKKESEKIPGKVKPFARVRRGKAEYVRGHERKTHGGLDPKYTGDPVSPKSAAIKRKMEEWGRAALKRMKAGEEQHKRYKLEGATKEYPSSRLSRLATHIVDTKTGKRHKIRD